MAGIRNVRPSWVTLEVDGGKPIGAGPKARTGGLFATFFARKAGASEQVLTVSLQPSADGATVKLTVQADGSRIVYREVFEQ